MKKILSIIMLVLPLLSCDKDDNIFGFDEIELEAFIIENYLRDAKQLYFNEIFQDTTHLNYANPIMEDNEVNKILKIIQAVYNLNSNESNTVFDVHKIHGYYCYSFNSINLKVNTELPEINNLSNNIFPTGESSLDDLLNTYHFDSVRTAYSYPDSPWLTVYTDDEYNMIPVENEFTHIESVQLAEFNKGCIGGGNNITLARDTNSATVTFSIGSGDCPAGCLHHKYWEFKVSNGIARFIRTYGS